MLTRTAQVALNTISNYARFGVMFLVFLVVTPIMVSCMGPDDFGLWTLMFSIVGFFGLLDMGFGTATVKFVAQFSGSGETNQQDKLISTLGVVYLVLAGVAALSVTAICPFFIEMFGIKSEQSGKAVALLWILSIRTALLYLPLSLFRHILYGHQRIYLINGVQAGTTLLYGAFTAGALKMGMGIVTVAWINLAMMILEHVLYIIPVYRMKPRPRFSWSLVDRKTFREVASVSVFSFIVNVAILIQLRCDPILINMFLPLSAVAVYSVAMKIAEQFHLLIKQFVSALSPLVAQMKGAGEETKLRFVLVNCTKYAMAPAMMLAVFLISTSRELLTAWVGPMFVDAAPILVVLLTAIVLSVPQMTASTVLTMTGHHKRTGWAAVFSVVVNVGTSLVLLVTMRQIIGVAIGTLVAEVVVDLGVIVPMALRLHSIGIWEFIRRIAPAALVPGAVQFGVTWGIVHWWQPGRLWMLCAAAMPGVLMYMVLFWRFFMDPSEKKLFSDKLLRFRKTSSAAPAAGEDKSSSQSK